MYLDVYIGRLDDPDFKWEGGDWNGNVPRRESPFFPDSPGRERLFYTVVNRIETGRYTGKQTDWGG